MMKKLVLLTLALAMTLSVFACTSAAPQPAQATAVPATEAPTEAATEAPAAPEATAEEAPAEPVGAPDPAAVPGEALALEKSPFVNPIVGKSDEGDYTFCGDPAVLIDGDTAYLYVGHDTAKITDGGYIMPDYLCYSSKDLQNWTYEGVVFSMKEGDCKWSNDKTSAWASQAVKHTDPATGKELYYLYYCTWDRTAQGKQSIGVATSETPTGRFTDLGKALVAGTVTGPETSGWNDIDPTVWIETDENGEEHRYLAWGNGLFYVCELNEDMISVKDRNGDGKITSGAIGSGADIINQQTGLQDFTEAPWLYRRTDETGKAYGPYYLFYAHGWREKMAYATADSLMDSEWTFGRVLMPPTATSNTNHMAVFDFLGKTWFVYHNGSLPAGHGFRRSPCITELHFDENGGVNRIPETAAGPWGTVVRIEQTAGDGILTHLQLANSSGDGAYPMLDVDLAMEEETEPLNSCWVLVAGKADPAEDTLVSIQSENKPGLYVTAEDDETLYLAQDADATAQTAEKQTFRSVSALDGSDGVSFESVAFPGRYLSCVDGWTELTDGSDATACSFAVTPVK